MIPSTNGYSKLDTHAGVVSLYTPRTYGSEARHYVFAESGAQAQLEQNQTRHKSGSDLLNRRPDQGGVASESRWMSAGVC